MFNKSEAFYLKIGSTWTLDGLYAFLLTPVSFAGLILNLTSIYLLFKINISSTRLYKYLRMYTVNSALICLILGFSFISWSPRFFPYFTEYYAKIFRCYLYNPLINTLFFLGNLMDIILSNLLIARINIFLDNLTQTIETSPKCN